MADNASTRRGPRAATSTRQGPSAVTSTRQGPSAVTSTRQGPSAVTSTHQRTDADSTRLVTDSSHETQPPMQWMKEKDRVDTQVSLHRLALVTMYLTQVSGCVLAILTLLPHLQALWTTLLPHPHPC